MTFSQAKSLHYFCNHQTLLNKQVALSKSLLHLSGSTLLFLFRGPKLGVRHRTSPSANTTYTKVR